MVIRSWNFNHAHANLKAQAAVSLNRIEADFTSSNFLRSTSKSQAYQRDSRSRLRRLFVGQRRERIKKELGIDVGDALAYVFTDTIAVTPPLFRIIIRVGG